MNDASRAASRAAAIRGEEHWTSKDGIVKLFMFEKCGGDPNSAAGTVLFVHGSSMASQPTFDLQVDGRPDSSVMDWFARRGFDCWCVDMEGYGRSTKDRDNNAPICARRRRLLRRSDLYSAAARQAAVARLRHFVGRAARGFIRAAPPAVRRPARARRHAVDRCGLADTCRAEKKLPEFKAKNRRPIDKAFIHSIFDRDHPGTAEEQVINAFADAVTALDSSVPTGTYVDMCSKLPVVDPAKITVPTLIMRGQWDGIAGFEDLLAFFDRLPNPDKHFAVMPGISHASFQQKNYALVYHILWSFFTQPAPIYRG